MFGRALSGISKVTQLITGKKNDDEWKALVEACAEGKDKYIWDGLAEVRISQYQHAKERAYEPFKDEYEEDDSEWVSKLDAQSRNNLKDLLLKRAIGLVHVLKPVEDERKSVVMLEKEGKLQDGYKESFEAADKECTAEVSAVMEESQLLNPKDKPNAIIQKALQMYAAGDDPLCAHDATTRGYLNKEGRKAHGFPIGCKVEMYGLKNTKLNGVQGRVMMEHGDLVACSFGRQYGERAFKPENLKLIEDHEDEWEPYADVPIINPEAYHMPTVTLEIVYQIPKEVPLGLVLRHEPPVEQQSEEKQGVLRISQIEKELGAHMHGLACTKFGTPELRLDFDDQILAVIDCKPEPDDREVISGNSQKMLDAIEAADRPLVFIILRELGPPLRFNIGETVLANCGERGMLAGTVEAVWADYQKGKAPYVIRLNSTGGGLFAPIDNDSAVQRAPPRFEIGADIMVNYEDSFKKGAIVELMCDRLHTSYTVLIRKEQLKDAEEDKEVFVPFDGIEFIRPKARFEVGTDVEVNADGKGWLSGLVKEVYNPRWVYCVELDDREEPVFIPLDIDNMIRER